MVKLYGCTRGKGTPERCNADGSAGHSTRAPRSRARWVDRGCQRAGAGTGHGIRRLAADGIPCQADGRAGDCGGRASAMRSRPCQGGGSNEPRAVHPRRVAPHGQAISTPSSGQPVLFRAAGRYLSLHFVQTKPLTCAARAASGGNCGATQIRARHVRTHFFHRFCNQARPMETPLCKISFLILTQQRFDRRLSIIYSR